MAAQFIGLRKTLLVLVILTFINVVQVLSFNDLCPALCKCEDEILRAICVYANLEVVPIQLNPEIKHLDLSNNRIESLNLAFGFYDNLESLDLSYNSLHTLGSNNFLLQKNLLTLNVSYNIIQNISKNSLKGLESLVSLDLSFNNLTNMDAQSLRHINELEIINLSGNSFTSLPNDLFKNLYKIQDLSLQNNSLLEIPYNNLKLIPSLNKLDLSDNLVEYITSNSIPILRSLVSLNLANNLIKYIADDAFESLPRLLYLNLEGNNLTMVPTTSLSNLNVLSYLNLARNPLSSLDNLAFRNLFELKTLNLRDCTIKQLKSRTFSDNINLENIYLDGNRELTYLPSRILYFAKYLKIVSLRHCNLSTLEPTYFPIDGLIILHVGGNPLKCNCSIHWLWNVINNESQQNNQSQSKKLNLDAHDITCIDQQLNEQLLMSLSESYLNCQISPLYLSLSIAACLISTAFILLLMKYIKILKQKKEQSFSTGNRPQLLVYVGTNDNVNETTAKQTPNYSSHLIHYNNQQNDFLNLPHSSVNKSNDHNGPNFYDPNKYSVNNSRDTATFLSFKNNVEGVYAVSNVTNLRESTPEVLSSYQVDNDQSEASNFNPCSSNNIVQDYEYDYCQPNINNKPHIVFV